MFSWVPHPWFLLAQGNKEARLDRAFAVSGRRFYTIFGGTTYLDRMAEKFYKQSQQVFSFAMSPFASQSDRYIDIIDDFVLTLRVDSRTASRIDSLFSAVRGAPDLEEKAQIELLKAKCSITITLEHNTRKAMRIRNQFTEFFGITAMKTKGR